MPEIEAVTVLWLVPLLEVALLATVVLVDCCVVLIVVLDEEVVLRKITANSAALVQGPRLPASVLAVIRT